MSEEEPKPLSVAELRKRWESGNKPAPQQQQTQPVKKPIEVPKDEKSDDPKANMSMKEKMAMFDQLMKKQHGQLLGLTEFKTTKKEVIEPQAGDATPKSDEKKETSPKSDEKSDSTPKNEEKPVKQGILKQGKHLGKSVSFQAGEAKCSVKDFMNAAPEDKPEEEIKEEKEETQVEEVKVETPAKEEEKAEVKEVENKTEEPKAENENTSSVAAITGSQEVKTETEAEAKKPEENKEVKVEEPKPEVKKMFANKLDSLFAGKGHGPQPKKVEVKKEEKKDEDEEDPYDPYMETLMKKAAQAKKRPSRRIFNTDDLDDF